MTSDKCLLLSEPQFPSKLREEPVSLVSSCFPQHLTHMTPSRCSINTFPERMSWLKSEDFMPNCLGSNSSCATWASHFIFWTQFCHLRNQIGFLSGSCGCRKRLPQAWWLKATETYSFIVLEARSPKARCVRGLCSLRRPREVPPCPFQLLVAPSSLVACGCVATISGSVFAWPSLLGVLFCLL